MPPNIKKSTIERWEVLPSGIPGLFDVYDQDGNHVARHKTNDRANLIAASPVAVEACKVLIQWFRDGGPMTRGNHVQFPDTHGFPLAVAAVSITERER